MPGHNTENTKEHDKPAAPSSSDLTAPNLPAAPAVTGKNGALRGRGSSSMRAAENQGKLLV